MPLRVSASPQRCWCPAATAAASRRRPATAFAHQRRCATAALNRHARIRRAIVAAAVAQTPCCQRSSRSSSSTGGAATRYACHRDCPRAQRSPDRRRRPRPRPRQSRDGAPAVPTLSRRRPSHKQQSTAMRECVMRHVVRQECAKGGVVHTGSSFTDTARVRASASPSTVATICATAAASGPTPAFRSFTSSDTCAHINQRHTGGRRIASQLPTASHHELRNVCQQRLNAASQAQVPLPRPTALELGRSAYQRADCSATTTQPHTAMYRYAQRRRML